MASAMERERRRSRRPGRLASPLAAALALGACAAMSALAHAGSAGAAEAAPRGFRLELAALGGSAQLDGRLADYQWDVAPRVGWGAEATVGRSPLAGGLRVWTTATRQRLDPALSSSSPAVRSSSLEALARARVAERWGTSVSVTATGGLLHLGYDPDQVTIDGGGVPVVVTLAPIDTWIAGGGVGFERGFAGRWIAGLELDHRIFELDAAHRNGGSIEVTRERFGDWNARLRLARSWGR